MVRRLLTLACLFLAFASGAVPADASPFSARRMKHVVSSYPAYVITADAAHGDQQMRAVWDLYTTAGSRILQGSLTAIAVASRPSGVSAPSGGAVTVSSTAAMSGVDFASNALFVVNNGTTFTLTDGWISAPAQTHQVRGGVNASGTTQGPLAAFDFEHVTVDLASGGNLAIAAIDGSTATLNYARILNAARDPIVFSGGVLTITNTLVGAIATNTTGVDHNESIYAIDGGTLVLSNSLVDMSYGSPFTGGFTGLIFLRAQTGDVTATVNYNILRGEGTINAPWTIQSKAVAGNVLASFTGNIFEIGASGFNGPLAFDCHTITFTDGGGNFTTAGSSYDVTTFIRAPGISGTPASTGAVGVPYSFTPTATCTPVPATGLSYSVPFVGGPPATDPLPPGLTVNASTGVISGTPTTPGVYPNITLKAQVSAGNSGTLGPFTITIS